MHRILIVANDETTIFNFRREIVTSFKNAGYEIIICYPFGKHTDEMQMLGCRLINIPISRHGTNVKQDLKLFAVLYYLIKNNAPDIVLTYTIKPNVYGSIACQIQKIPYINNVTGLGSIINSKRKLGDILLLMQRVAFRKSSCVFLQNQENKVALCKAKVISLQTRTVILPGSGVNLEKHKYEPFPADDGITRFIIVSRLRKDKGYDEFLEAAEIIKEEYPNTEFHIVGWIEEEIYKEKIDRLVGKGLLYYHGEKTQEEVHELITRCNCLVHPSYHEGMSNVLLEAAAAGRPVIASNIPGCRETFDEGISGFGFTVRDTSSLVSAIRVFLGTEYCRQREMGLAGRRKIEAEFDRRFVADAYLKVIREILNDKNDFVEKE